VRVLVDTNILISAALFPEGKVARVLNHLFETHTVVVASFSIQECEQVFVRKFPAKFDCLHQFLADIDYELFDTPENLDPLAFPQIRDAADVPILASAILADVDILISGDKDFDGLEMKRPLVFNPQRYFELING
jgi:putative PIN family toxin of toxin-antitoxin system